MTRDVNLARAVKINLKRAIPTDYEASSWRRYGVATVSIIISHRKGGIHENLGGDRLGR